MSMVAAQRREYSQKADAGGAVIIIGKKNCRLRNRSVITSNEWLKKIASGMMLEIDLCDLDAALASLSQRLNTLLDSVIALLFLCYSLPCCCSGAAITLASA
jgi:hypothetical protein